MERDEKERDSTAHSTRTSGVYASSHEPVISFFGIRWPGRAYCNGTVVGAVVGVGVILSYLVLFVAFYLVTVPPIPSPRVVQQHAMPTRTPPPDHVRLPTCRGARAGTRGPRARRPRR